MAERSFEGDNIVFAEDEAHTRTSLNVTFSRLFPESSLHLCENAEEGIAVINALRQSANAKLSLVVSDGTMPPSQTHGLDFYKELRDAGVQDVPFILSSGDYDLEGKIAAVGADKDPLFRFLSKPTLPKDWMPVIQELFRVRDEIAKANLPQ